MEEGETIEMKDLKDISTWKNQISFHGCVASLAIGFVYSVIVMKLNLTTGLVPTLNVTAALLAFVLLRSRTKLLHKTGIMSMPFTRQENTVVQTCVVACYSIAVGGEFGSYLLGLNKKTYELVGADTAGNEAGSYKEPGISWMTGFLFVVSFIGLLILVPLKKIMIIDYKVTFPSGTATAVLINGFHAAKGEKMATLTYVGAGMICSHLVDLLLVLGAVLSWGIMWPLIRELKGEWYPSTISESSMRSLQGHKLYIYMQDYTRKILFWLSSAYVSYP